MIVNGFRRHYNFKAGVYIQNKKVTGQTKDLVQVIRSGQMPVDSKVQRKHAMSLSNPTQLKQDIPLPFENLVIQNHKKFVKLIDSHMNKVKYVPYLDNPKTSKYFLKRRRQEDNKQKI